MSTNLACSKKLWSREEDKAFENALAIYSGYTNRWEKITAAVPGRTIEEIKDHFEILCADVEAIHAGRVPLPQYKDYSIKSESSAPRGGKRNQSEKKPSQPSQGEGSSRINGRKKGVPWTSEEHRSFLQGLKKYGRGDWRSISRHCVLSRTSTQVASHAQKYFKRLDEVTAANKRAGIHDTSTLNDGKSVTESTLPEGQEGVLGKFPTLDSSYMCSDTCFMNENVGVHSSSYLPSENAGVDDLQYYPGTGQPRSDISIPKWPGTEQMIGIRQPGFSQQGIFSPQGTSSEQMISFSDAGFIADDWMVNQNVISFQGPSYAQQIGAPPVNSQEQIPRGPMSAQQIGAPTVTSQDYISTPETQSFVQTVEKGWESCAFNFGESSSASGSSFNNVYGHPDTSEWLLPPVAASTVAEPDIFCSPTIPMMYDSGALDYGSFSPTAYDLAELEYPFSPSSGQI